MNSSRFANFCTPTKASNATTKILTCLQFSIPLETLNNKNMWVMDCVMDYLMFHLQFDELVYEMLILIFFIHIIAQCEKGFKIKEYINY